MNTLLMQTDLGRRTMRRGTGLLLIAAVVGFAVPASARAQQPTGAPEGPELTIEQAVRIALEQSRDLEEARLELDAAEEQVREAWGGVYPSVNLSTTYTRNLAVPVNFLPAQIFDPEAPEGDFIEVRFGADNQWLGQVDIEQPLLQATAFVGVGAAGRFRTFQREVVRGRMQQAVTQVRTSFLEALLASESERVSENSVERVQRTLEDTRAMYEAGLASEYDVLRLEVEEANLSSEAERARNASLAARRVLAVELGLDAAEPVPVAGSLASLDLETPSNNGGGNGVLLAFVGLDSPETMDPDEVVALARERRSDLRQAELNVERTEIELRLERAERLPTLSLFGTYQLNAQSDGTPGFFGGSSGQRADARQVGIRFSMPIFSGFQRSARAQQGRAAVRGAGEQLGQARVASEAEIRGLLDQARETRGSAGRAERAVRQAERGHEIAQAEFREGIGSRIEVTDAENALRQSELNYARAVHDYLAARAGLDQAVGMVPMVSSETDGFVSRRIR